MVNEFKTIEQNIKGYFIKVQYKPNPDLNPIGKWKQSNHLAFELKNYLHQNVGKEKKLPKKFVVGGSDIEIIELKKNNIYKFN